MSNHPIEQKTAEYRFHIKRMQSLPLDSNKKQKRMANNTIHCKEQQLCTTPPSETQPTDTQQN